MQWRIGQKIALAFALPFAAILAGGAIAVRAIQQFDAGRSAAMVSHLLSAISDGHAQADSELVLFAATGEPQHLEAHLSAFDRVHTDALSLRALAADDPERRPFVQRVYNAVTREVALARKIDQVPRERAAAAADQALRSAENRQIDAAARAAVAEMNRWEQQRLAPGFFAFPAETAAAVRLVWLGTALTAAVVGLAGVLLTLVFTRSVRRLLEATRRIRDGALDTRLRPRSRDELGQLAAAFNEMADALQRAQTDLQQSTQILRSVLDSMADGVMVADRNGKLVLMNRAAADILGTSPSRTDIPFERPEDTPLALAIQGETVRDIELLISGAGVYPDRWVIAAAGPVMDPQGLWGGVMVMTDITERKCAQQALQESEAKFRSFIETTNEWIWSADVNGRLTYSNPALHSILGYFPAQLPGANIRDLVLPEDCARFSQVLAGIGPNQERAASVVAKWRHEHGTERWLESNIVPVVDETGALAGYRGSARDITLRQYAEAELQKLNGELRRRIDQLNAVNKELEAFSYSVSHDLRAPLRAIDGFSQALLEDYSDRLDADGQDYLRRVRAASQRMAHLIDDLLNLSRVARNEIARSPVDVTELARSVVTVLRERDPNRAIDIIVAEHMRAQADARLVRILLENLLGNAWKFTRTKAAPRIEIEHIPNNGHMAFVVRDNGVGFDMAYANKLFGAFQRLHANDEFEGTGIGLAIVQRIVNRHGGRVWAEAEPGEGAAFYFTLS